MRRQLHTPYLSTEMNYFDIYRTCDISIEKNYYNYRYDHPALLLLQCFLFVSRQNVVSTKPSTVINTDLPGFQTGRFNCNVNTVPA